jgi:environmental stress-induced protein Ves
VRGRRAGRTLARQEFLTVAGQVLRSSDYQRMPWKNGGGTTTEIWKEVSASGEMLWRLSIADVASDGPFSKFPGIDRWIMVIEGKGMELSIAGMGERRLDRRFDPLFFPGDAKTDCRLIDGPIRDFNFMIARRCGQGSLRVFSLESDDAMPANGNIAAVHVLRGSVQTGGRMLAQGDTWIADRPQAIDIQATQQTLLAAISIDRSQVSGA